VRRDDDFAVRRGTETSTAMPLSCLLAADRHAGFLTIDTDRVGRRTRSATRPGPPEKGILSANRTD